MPWDSAETGWRHGWLEFEGIRGRFTVMQSKLPGETAGRQAHEMRISFGGTGLEHPSIFRRCSSLRLNDSKERDGKGSFFLGGSCARRSKHGPQLLSETKAQDRDREIYAEWAVKQVCRFIKVHCRLSKGHHSPAGYIQGARDCKVYSRSKGGSAGSQTLYRTCCRL